MEKVMEKVIDSFSGDFDFLSNFSRHSFRDIDGIYWMTVEHKYQAMKTTNMVDRGRIWSAGNPGIAKRMGQKVEMRPDWTDVFYTIMFTAVGNKFNQKGTGTWFM